MTEPITRLLEELRRRDVKYILVGGMAAVVHGAPVTTLDIDVVHSRDPANLDRVMAFLESVNAFYRGQPRGRKLGPSRAGLEGTGHNQFSSDLGPIDFLCELAPGQGYDELYPFSEVVKDGTLSVRVVGLKKLVEIKIETGRPKDRLMIPLLMKLLEG